MVRFKEVQAGRFFIYRLDTLSPGYRCCKEEPAAQSQSLTRCGYEELDMSRHRWMKEEGDQISEPHMPQSEFDGGERDLRTASSGFAVRAGLRAGESQGAESLLDKVKQWFQSLTSSF